MQGNPPSTAGQGQATEVQGITVTATGTNITGVKPVGDETISLDRQQILATGQTNIDDLLQDVPQVQNNPSASGQVYRQGGTAGYGSGAGENSTQGTAINLRGLGAVATLTLVDGRRVAPTGASNAFTEAIQVPIAALERIEIVADGNSAIYGSDAVAGVVNYVLRKDFNGVEVSARGTDTRYYDEWGASITVGHTWQSLGALGAGNFILTYDHDDRGHMTAGDSPFLRENLTPLDHQSTNRMTGAVIYGYYGIPAGSGAGTTFAQLSPTPSVLDSSDYTDYLGRQKRDQFAGFINQDLPETATNYSIGFDFQPHWLRGFKFSTNYYNIHYN